MKISFKADEESQVYSLFIRYLEELKEKIQIIERYRGQESPLVLERSYKRLSKGLEVVFLINSAQNWISFILEQKKVPKSDIKKFQGAAEVFMKMTRPPNKLEAWWTKNYPKFQILIDAKKWPQKQEDSEEKYKIGSFIVHNTLHLQDDDLLKTNASIEAAIKFLKGSGFQNTIYGDVLIVGKLMESRTMAWYSYDEDKIYLRPLLKIGRGEVHNLIHEIGHRYWHKFLSPLAKREWATYYHKINSQEVSVELTSEQTRRVEELKKLKVGNIFPEKIAGAIRGGQPIIEDIRYVGDAYTQSINWKLRTPKGLTFIIKLRDLINSWKSINGKISQRNQFPTPYASTSLEEFFSESFAMYSMKTLEKPWLEEFERIVKK